MRGDRGTKIVGLVALIGIVSVATGSVASPAFASDECQRPQQPAQTVVSEGSVDVTVALPADPDGCLSVRLDAQHDRVTDGPGSDDCADPCPAREEVSVSAEIVVRQDVRDPTTGDPEAPLLSTGASQQIEQCATAGQRTGTVCAERESTSAPEEDPDPNEGPVARTITLGADRYEAGPRDTVRFFGSIESEGGCAVGRVELLAKRGGDSGFHRFRATSSSADGTFSFEVVVGNATEFRAAAPADEACQEALSQVVHLRERR